nr:hypothetical protein [Tanacetum cinerariifolium]
SDSLGLYHKKNVDFAYLLWEDFIYQVEHRDAKKSNEMYYPRFTKVIIHYFMSKDPSIPRRNKVKWHYVRDDQLFTTIKLVSRHQNTQQFDAMLPIELTNKDIRNSEVYKEYYAVATGAAPPKTKASVRKTKSSFDTTNVHKKHRNPKACGRPLTRCRKLPEEAQPHQAGFNKDKQNRLMRIDELHKFSDGTLNDVRTALDDRLKGIRMKYLPQTI